MPLSEQLILETQQAFRALDSLEDRLDRLSDVRLEVTADTTGLNADLARTNSLVDETAQSFGKVNDEVTLTTDQYIQAVRAIEQGADAAQAVAVATGKISMEAVTVDDAYRSVARALDVSEDEARELAVSLAASTREATQLDVDIRRIARSMGISDDEANKFIASMRTAQTATAQTATASTALATGLSKVRTLIIGAVAAFGIRGLVNQFSQAIESTNALGESVNAVKVTFGEGADEVIRFAETAAEAAGLATSQAQQLVVPIGVLLRNFGFEAEQAGEAAVVLTQRAADLASVFNSEVPEALTAISAALRGEADPLERFGASINAARVESFALANGLAETKAEITDAIRVQARYQLILADTASAAGDFAATSDDAANATRILQAEAENARAELGEALLPAFEALIGVAPELIDAIERMAPAIANAAGSFADFVEDAEPFLVRLGQIQQVLGAMGDAAGLARTPILQTAEAFGQLASGDIGGAAAEVGELGEALGGFFSRLQNRGVFIAFQEALLTGADASELFGEALVELAQNSDLTRENIEQFAAAADLDLDDQVATLAELAETGELTGDQFRVLIDILTELNNTQRGGGLNFERGRRELDGVADSTERVAEAAAKAAESNDNFELALRGLSELSEQTGLSLGFLAANTQLLDADLAVLVGQFGAGALEAEAFNRAAGNLATSIQFDFSDAVDEFDLLINKTNEAGDKVPTTVAEMLEDLRTQAERFARLEAATTILEVLGFDSLAADLRSKGPEAVEAAEAFVADIAGAIEAESLFDEGGTLGDTGVAGLLDALEDGDITPGLLDLASQFTSNQVQQMIAAAALDNGTLYGTELQKVLNALNISMPVDVFLANTTGDLLGGSSGSSGGSTGSSSGSGGSSGGISGGATPLSVTNNFFATPAPTAATNQIINATSAILKGAI